MKQYKLTKGQIKKLQPLEKYFNTIEKAQYKRASLRSEDELAADILQAVTGEVQQRNFSCAQCVYNIYNKLAKIYYASIK